ncbi:hypothetical protein JW921_03330 [Candidatus Fermentibacterales bacterium]|nr:hypothetical protein [Candidatus Fermentibacterales bacterium]
MRVSKSSHGNGTTGPGRAELLAALVAASAARAAASPGAAETAGNDAAIARARPFGAVIEIDSLRHLDGRRAGVLGERAEWTRLCGIWRRLGAIEADFDQEWYSGGDLEWSKANLLRIEADSLIAILAGGQGPDGAALIDSAEASMLSSLIEARLNLFSYGVPGMLTRMMPSRIEFDKGSLLQHLELRIDALSGLLQSGTVSAFEATGVLWDIVETAQSFVLVDAVSLAGYMLPSPAGFGRTTPDIDPVTLLEGSVAALDSSAAALLAQIERWQQGGDTVPEHMLTQVEMISRARDRLRALGEAMPGFRSLVLAIETGSRTLP